MQAGSKYKLLCSDKKRFKYNYSSVLTTLTFFSLLEQSLLSYSMKWCSTTRNRFERNALTKRKHNIVAHKCTIFILSLFWYPCLVILIIHFHFLRNRSYKIMLQLHMRLKNRQSNHFPAIFKLCFSCIWDWRIGNQTIFLPYSIPSK